MPLNYAQAFRQVLHGSQGGDEDAEEKRWQEACHVP